MADCKSCSKTQEECKRKSCCARCATNKTLHHTWGNHG